MKKVHVKLKAESPTRIPSRLRRMKTSNKNISGFFFFFPPPAHHSRPHRENSGRIRDIWSALGQTSYSTQRKPQSHQDVLNDSTPARVGELCNEPLK